MTTETAPAEWSSAKRIGFRFLFCYFALYFFPLPSGLAEPDWISGIFDKPWQMLSTWVARHVFHIQLTTFTNGSGDTTYDYIRVLCMVVIALLAAAAWSLAAKRREYRTLHAWARLWLRYALAASMFTYGIVKVIKLQFADPNHFRLTETYGDSSPMGLLWTFMGFSAGYTFFAGAGELLSSLLLFFRRTATLGALVATAVLANVVTLNFCYDVPVKLGSSHLLILALFLVAPDLRRIADLLILNRPAAPADLEPEGRKPWMVKAGWALKAVVIAILLGPATVGAVGAYRQRQAAKAPVLPDGFYLVDRFVEDGTEVPPLPTDHHRWKKFVLLKGYVRTWNMDGSTDLYRADGDAKAGPVSLVPVNSDTAEPLPGAKPVGNLLVKPPAGGAPGSVEGPFNGKSLRVAISFEDRGTSNFPLMNRGFHWISEAPYNR